MKRFVMIGCGGFSRRYHVPILKADKQLQWVGIFDPHPTDAVKELAQQTGAKLVDRIDLLPAANAALITTPHTLHAQHVDFALNKGWATMVDKPFVMHTKDALQLIEKANNKKLLNAVGFNRRMDPGCLKTRELIANGKIGQIRFVQTIQLGYEAGGWFLQPELGGGGAFTGRATHMADIVPWLLQKRPHRVRSRLRPGPAGRVDRGGFIDLEFDQLECQMTCIDQGLHMWDEIRIFGESGFIELRRPLNFPTGWAMQCLSADGQTVVDQVSAQPGEGVVTNNFLNALHQGAAVACSFSDALLSVEIIEAAFESAKNLQVHDAHAIELSKK
jgi:predicted dehydrogenase